jgi:hypothetical protein
MPVFARRKIFNEGGAVFICYAHEDNQDQDPKKRWLDRLLQVLQPLVRQELLKIWSDKDIEIGDQWHELIGVQLQASRAAVLLISPAFLASEYIVSSELPALLKNVADGGASVLPLIISPCLYEETIFKYPDPTLGPNLLKLSSLQSANPPSRTLIEMSEAEQNRVLIEVARRLWAKLRKTYTQTLLDASVQKASRTQFETEFDAYKEIYAALTEVRYAIEQNTPVWIPPSLEDAKVKDKWVRSELNNRFKNLATAHNKLVTLRDNLAPFYATEVHAALGDCVKTSEFELFQVRIAGQKTFSTRWYQDAYKRQFEFLAAYRKVGELIRERIASLGIVEQ